VRIDEQTGERVTPNTKSSRFEIFREGHEPAKQVDIVEHVNGGVVATEAELEDENENLF